MASRSTHDVRCARCGGIAATFTLAPPEDGGGPWTDRHRLTRSGFFGKHTIFRPEEELARLFELIASGDLAAVRQVDIDFAAFHCSDCSKAYCESCWHVHPPIFDAGFYDYTLGTCPDGHEQIVDD